MTNPLVPVWVDKWLSFLYETMLFVEFIPLTHSPTVGGCRPTYRFSWLAGFLGDQQQNLECYQEKLVRTANPAAFTPVSRVFFSLLLCSKHASGQCVVRRAYLKNDPKVWTAQEKVRKSPRKKWLDPHGHRT